MKTSIPNKFHVKEKASVQDIYEFLDNQKSINDWYVHAFHLEKTLNDNEWLKISKLLKLEIMKYGDMNYVDFKQIHDENEFHFDGISSPNLSRVPSVLGFESIRNHKQIGGEMKLLNCCEILKKIDKDIYKILKNNSINYYGMKSFFNKAPKRDELVFSIKPIAIHNKLEFLRLHLPTINEAKRKVTDLGIYSFNDDYTCCLNNHSAKDSIEIFDHI